MERGWQSQSKHGCNVAMVLLCSGGEALTHVLIFVFGEGYDLWRFDQNAKAECTLLTCKGVHKCGFYVQPLLSSGDIIKILKFLKLKNKDLTNYLKFFKAHLRSKQTYFWKKSKLLGCVVCYIYLFILFIVSAFITNFSMLFTFK